MLPRPVPVLGLLALLLLLLLAPAPARAQTGDAPDGHAITREAVRVRLFARQRLSAIEVVAHDGPLAFRLAKGGDALGRLAATGTARLRPRGGEVEAALPEAGGFFAPRVHVTPVDEATQWTLVAGGERRTYAGHLVVTVQGDALVVVNETPVEDYVAGVVSAEYGLDDDEGAKAMAVVARTYGLKAAQKFDGDYDHGDGTLSQVYSGLSAITPGARRAAEATRGEVLTYGGDLIEATYFSSSGGHTANNEDVWDASAALPYLRGRPDPYDAEAPNRRWTVALDRAAVLRVLGRRFGGEVVGFVVADRSRDGRVRTIGLLRPGRQREAVQANAFRLALSAVPGPALKSTWFTARRSGDRYVFEGRGFGHGVGLSQYGAHAMSERGMSYRDILAFYYQGATLTRLRPDRPLAAQLDASGDTQQARQETLTRPRRRIGW